MLNIFIPTRRKVKNHFSSPQTSSTSTLLEKDEYLKRNKIIVDLYQGRKYDKGDLIRPSNDQAYEKEGLYRVIQICKNWMDYRGSESNEYKVQWPDKTDNPLIITAMRLSNNEIVNATMNYFIKHEGTDVNAS